MNSAEGGVIATTDFSKGATSALREAHTWATHNKLPLVLAHVLEDMPANPSVPLPWLQPFAGQLDVLRVAQVAHEQALARLNQVADDLGIGGDQTFCEVRSGSALQAIPEITRELTARFVVMGRTGAGALERYILGGTALRMIGRLMSTLILASEDHSPAKKIVIPVDFGPCSGAQLAVLRNMPLASDVEITLVSAWQMPDDFREAIDSYFSRGEEKSRIEEEMNRRLDMLVEGHVPSHFRVNRIIEEGAVSHVVLEAAKDADTVILGTLGQATSTRLLPGRTALRISREFSGRLLVVPPVGGTVENLEETL